MPVTILPYGDRALLLELVGAGGDGDVTAWGYGDVEAGGDGDVQAGGHGDVQAGASAQVSAAIRAAGPPLTSRLVDIVPAECTVLVTTRPGTDLVTLRADLLAVLSAAGAGLGVRAPGVDTAAESARLVTIPVRYDGPDLDDVARHTGLTVAEVTAAHEASRWEVAFCGFVPGFAYLVGGDPRLEVPRRSIPRTVVPAGAVALAGRYSGIYPRPSPGGWQLIGSTSAVLFDPHREAPALLRPGDRVRFVASPA